MSRDIKVEIHTLSRRFEGHDVQLLVKDISEELEAFAHTAQTSGLRKVEGSPPEGAQGEPEFIMWLWEQIQDPTNLKYLRILIFTLNSIIQSRTNEEQGEDDASKKEGDKGQPAPAKLVVFGKEIPLPAAARALEVFIKELGED